MNEIILTSFEMVIIGISIFNLFVLFVFFFIFINIIHTISNGLGIRYSNMWIRFIQLQLIEYLYR